MEQADTHSTQRMDLLGHDCQEIGNKNGSCSPTDARIIRGEKATVLLARLSSSKAKGREVV